MAEYHIGCGAFSIYAGTLNKDKNKWVNKSEATDEALVAVRDYLLIKKKPDDKKFSIIWPDQRTHRKIILSLEVEDMGGESCEFK